MTDYDIDYLISLIEARPVLWDKTIAEYKDKLLKTNAWKDVCRSLFANFEELNNEEKTELGNDVIKKWRGIKDNFAKYEKKIKDSSKFGAGAKKIKQYHLYNQLLFLNKNAQNETVSSITEDEEILNRASTSTQQTSQKTVMPRYQPAPRKRKTDEFEDHILTTLREPGNRHLSFFKGILSSVEKLNDNQTLIFQSRVLQILTDLLQPSHCHSHQTPSQSGCQTSFQQSGYQTSQTPVQSGYQTSQPPAQSGYEISSPSTLRFPRTPSQDLHDTINLKEELTNLSSATHSDYDFS